MERENLFNADRLSSLIEEEPVWKYNESEIIDKIYDYCESTYEEHYAEGNIEPSEFISASGHGQGFFLGNVIKYANRYGKKGGYNKKDLMKTAHYCIMAIWEHEKRESLEKSTKETI